MIRVRVSEVLIIRPGGGGIGDHRCPEDALRASRKIPEEPPMDPRRATRDLNSPTKVYD